MQCLTEYEGKKNNTVNARIFRYDGIASYRSIKLTLKGLKTRTGTNLTSLIASDAKDDTNEPIKNTDHANRENKSQYNEN
jgi:hypothetical protein